MFAYVGRNQNLKDLKDQTKGIPLDQTTKPEMSSRGCFLRKGEVLAYVWLIHNLKDLKDPEQPGKVTFAQPAGPYLPALPKGKREECKHHPQPHSSTSIVNMFGHKRRI